MIPLLRRELSLDAFVETERDYRLEPFLADPKAVDPLQRVHELETRRAVERALLALDQRDRFIIRSRFGFVGGEGKTLEQIGNDLNLSRERIRQLESAAMKRLRSSLVLFEDPHPIHSIGTAKS